MSYRLTVEKRPSYLYTKVVGERTTENALRYLHEVYTVCVNNDYSRVLLDMKFQGPSLNTTQIFEVIAQRATEGARLRKIAYVEGTVDDAAMPAFAETVALNRGVNVRRFDDVGMAASWLTHDA